MLQAVRARRDRALQEIENLRNAAPPTQVQVDKALEHARAPDEARRRAEVEHDKANASGDRAYEAYLAEKQQREDAAAKRKARYNHPVA